MEFMDIVKKRYSAKEFDGKVVPEEKIAELLEMIRFAASSFGLQPYKVQVITAQETKEKLFPVSYNQKQVTTCSHVLIFHANTDIEGQIDKYAELMRANGTPEENIVGYTGVMRGFVANLSEEAKLVWAQKQTYIALGNGLNGAAALGLDACPMEGFDSVEYAKILETPKNLIPTVVMPVGYAADTPRKKIRYTKEDLFF